MVRQKIVGARPDGRISAPARYALLRRSLRDVPQERVLRPTEGGGRIWDPPLHPAGAGTLEGRLGSAQRSGPGGKRSRPNPTAAPSICPGPLCGEQPLHPPGPGPLDGRPGSAQRSGPGGKRSRPNPTAAPSICPGRYAESSPFTRRGRAPSTAAPAAHSEAERAEAEIRRFRFPPRPRSAPSNAEVQFFAGQVRRRVDGAIDLRRTDSRDPRIHKQEDRTVLLFVKTVFSSTGRGAFSFAKTKENGGRIPRGDPAPPSRPAGKRDIPRTPLPETLAADCLLTPRCGPAATAAPNTAFAGGRWPPWPGWRHRPPPGSAAPVPGSGPCTARPEPSATGRRA